MIVPDVFEQHRARHHLAGVAHQAFEQAEFALLQIDHHRAARNAAGEAIEHEIADDVTRHLFLGRDAAHQRLDAGEQFGEGERFGQVVVAAGSQALDAVVHLRQRRKNEHRRLVAARAQTLDDGETVTLGQHAIDDDDIVVGALGQIEPGIAVVGHVGTVPALAQRLGEVG